MRFDIPDFDGTNDSIKFCDWLASIEDYFNFNSMSNHRSVSFAKLTLVGMAEIWWFSVETDIRRLGQPPIKTWQEMKSIILENYMFPCCCCKLREPVTNLRQGSMSIMEYVEKFDDLVARSRATKDSHQTISLFKAGLRRNEIRRELDHEPLHRWRMHLKWRLVLRFLRYSKKNKSASLKHQVYRSLLKAACHQASSHETTSVHEAIPSLPPLMMMKNVADCGNDCCENVYGIMIAETHKSALTL